MLIVFTISTRTSVSKVKHTNLFLLSDAQMQNVTDTSVYDILSLFYGHVLDKDLDGSKSLKRYVESNNSEKRLKIREGS